MIEPVMVPQFFRTSEKTFPWNQYLNTLKSKVIEGWIIILDDDDFLINKFSLQKIVEALPDENSLLIYKMEYPNGSILPDREYWMKTPFTRKHISMQCFCFHSKFRNLVHFDGLRAGDFRFINNLLNYVDQTYWLDEVIVGLSNFGLNGSKKDLTDMKKNENQINLEQCGASLPGYEKTNEFDGEFINKTHVNISKVSTRERGLIDIHGIFGFLFKQEALKLFEMAFFCKGDILEIGSHQGLSSFIMAHALHDAKKESKIHTYDVHKGYQDQAIANIERKGFSTFVEFHLEDGLIAVKNWIDKKKKFSMAFIDHDHTFQPNFELCKLLDKVIAQNGFVLFHDYNDRRNKSGEYGVWKAVDEGLDKTKFTFYGIVGSIAIYRRK
jgi:predicted O-methyltransferase YrrM